MSEHFSGPQDGIETPRTKRDTAGYLLLLVASRFASEGIHNSTTFNSPSVTKTAMMITMMMMMEIVGLRVVIKGSRKFRRNPTPGLSLFSNSEKPRFRCTSQLDRVEFLSSTCYKMHTLFHFSFRIFFAQKRPVFGKWSFFSSFTFDFDATTLTTELKTTVACCEAS